MRRLRGGIWDAPNGLDTEENLNKLGMKLKVNAKSKYWAWNGQEHVKLYDVIDAIPKDTKQEEFARKRKQKEKKYISCSECGVRKEVKEETESKYCEECLEEHTMINNRYLEKTVKEKDIYVKIENIHRNKMLTVNLTENKEQTMSYLKKNKKLKLEVKEKSGEQYIELYAGKMFIGLLPSEIIIKKYKSLPSITIKKERIADMIEKGNFKVNVELATYQQKKNFQNKISHELIIKLTKKEKENKRRNG